MSKTTRKYPSKASPKKAIKDREVQTVKSGTVRGGVPAVQKPGR